MHALLLSSIYNYCSSLLDGMSTNHQTMPLAYSFFRQLETMNRIGIDNGLTVAYRRTLIIEKTTHLIFQ